MLCDADEFTQCYVYMHYVYMSGLMFMLVLGETMLGFLVQRGNAIIDAQTYNTLMYAVYYDIHSINPL